MWMRGWPCRKSCEKNMGIFVVYIEITVLLYRCVCVVYEHVFVLKLKAAQSWQLLIPNLDVNFLGKIPMNTCTLVTTFSRSGGNFSWICCCRLLAYVVVWCNYHVIGLFYSSKTIHQSDWWIYNTHYFKTTLLDGYYTNVRILPPVFDTALNLLPIHNLRPAKNEDINIVKDDLWHAYTVVMMQNVLSRSSLHWLR